MKFVRTFSRVKAVKQFFAWGLLLSATQYLPAFGQESGAIQGTNFYSGKIVNIIVSTGSGTGYDMISRTLAKHLPKHIPGAPSVTVQNMPGASGINAANYVYNNAPKDGTVVGNFQGIIPFEPLLGTKEARYDALMFNWLGSLTQETGVLIARPGIPAINFADLNTQELTIGTSSPTSQDAIFARLFNQIFKLKLKTIMGYPAQNDVFLAMDRGEIDGRFVYYSSLASTRPDWITKKQVKLLVQYGSAKEPSIGDIPSMNDIVTNSDDKLLMLAAFAPLTLGRSYLMPPGVPLARVTVMRHALASILKDAAFLRDMESQMFKLDFPLTGDEVETFIKSVYAMSPSILNKFRNLVHP